MTLLRSLARAGLLLLAYGLCRVDFLSLVLDFAHPDPSLPPKSMSHLEPMLPVYGLTCLGSPLLLLDHAHLGSAMLLRGHTRLGPSLLAYGVVRMELSLLASDPINPDSPMPLRSFVWLGSSHPGLRRQPPWQPLASAGLRPHRSVFAPAISCTARSIAAHLWLGLP